MSDQINRIFGLESILDDVRNFINRFCVFPSKHCLIAVTLWAAHTHIIEHLWTTPRLAIVSPELSSGKTRVLEVLELLVLEGLLSLSASPASIFRLLAMDKITLLFDEADTVFSKHGKDDAHEDLRALLNSGYRKGATIPRCVPPKHDVVRFEVFCAAALAGIGNLPDTITSRSVIIRMKRRAENERIEQFRYRHEQQAGHKLRDRLSVWASENGKEVVDHIPEMPVDIVDLPAEVWEPLLTVADFACGEWPQLARDACEYLCSQAIERRDSLGVRLLSDLRRIFKGGDRLRTAEIIDRLIADPDSVLDDDAPWAEIRGHPINSRVLARLLKPYGIKPTKVRIDDKPFQGYYAADLHDAWIRYLPSLCPEKAEQSEQSEQSEQNNVTRISTVPDVPDVPDMRTAGGACPKCAGEGCKWCESQQGISPG